MNHKKLDLSVIIPALHESVNLEILLPQIHQVLKTLDIIYEIIIVDECADIKTHELSNRFSSRLVIPGDKGYGTALQAGFEQAWGNFIITMDADLSHSPDFLISLWNKRDSSDIIIASRYIPGGKAIMPFTRLVLSKILNLVFSRGLDLSIKDMSSGYRLYKSSVLKNGNYINQDFDILQEILVLALINGFRVLETPFTYHPRKYGSSHARVIKFGIKYYQTFSRLWKLRNSIASADYDSRAYDTLFLPQRYWQRQRYKHITKMIRNEATCLDVGCGSSRILGALPEGSIGLDIQMSKLRYSRRFSKSFINGSATSLPIADESIKCLICSEVIEHIEAGTVLSELDRVLIPGGRLILGTPDYDKWEWIWIEKLYKIILPQAYADEHITHYTYQGLINEFIIKKRYSVESQKYILSGELIICLRKPML